MRNIDGDNDDDYELTETIKRQNHFVTVLQQELICLMRSYQRPWSWLVWMLLILLIRVIAVVVLSKMKREKIKYEKYCFSLYFKYTCMIGKGRSIPTLVITHKFNTEYLMKFPELTLPRLRVGMGAGDGGGGCVRACARACMRLCVFMCLCVYVCVRERGHNPPFYTICKPSEALCLHDIS